MEPILDIERHASVFTDGLDGAKPRLDHPECVAVHPDGSVWCGSEHGEIFRIARDGSSREIVASTGGFCLGVTFAGENTLYVCDNQHCAVFRLDVRTGELERFADGADGRAMRIPNAIAVAADGTLYITDSHAFKEPGPGIWRFTPEGDGMLWDDRPINFANGIALAPDGRSLAVAASFAGEVLRVHIAGDGSPGERETIVKLPGMLPDGVAYDDRGRLHVACYEPSQVVRVEEDGTPRVLIADPEAHMLCHPTNLAFRGSTMFTANLGRWHVTAVDVAGA